MEAIAARAGSARPPSTSGGRPGRTWRWRAFFSRTRPTIDVPSGASLAEALTTQVARWHGCFRDTPAGPLMRDLIAAAQADPDIRAALEERWLRPRERSSAACSRAASAAANWRGLDTDVPAPSTSCSRRSTTGCCSAHQPLSAGWRGRWSRRRCPSCGPPRPASGSRRGPKERGQGRDGPASAAQRAPGRARAVRAG